MHESEKVKVKSLSCVQLFETPWTATHQAPPSMDFPGKSTGVGCHCLLRISHYLSTKVGKSLGAVTWTVGWEQEVGTKVRESRPFLGKSPVAVIVKLSYSPNMVVKKLLI